MNGDQAQKVVEQIEVLLLTRLGKQGEFAYFDRCPDELSGYQLNALFDAREELRQALVG